MSFKTEKYLYKGHDEFRLEWWPCRHKFETHTDPECPYCHIKELENARNREREEYHQLRNRAEELEQKIAAIKALPSYYLECPTGEFDQMTSATEIMNILSPVCADELEEALADD